MRGEKLAPEEMEEQEAEERSEATERSVTYQSFTMGALFGRQMSSASVASEDSRRELAAQLDGPIAGGAPAGPQGRKHSQDSAGGVSQASAGTEIDRILAEPQQNTTLGLPKNYMQSGGQAGSSSSGGGMMRKGSFTYAVTK